MVLRNVVPRQGTETQTQRIVPLPYHIEKCSSPTGDGNRSLISSLVNVLSIEKCSSPTGDGNIKRLVFILYRTGLRNVVPRQGTETMEVSS